MYWIEISKNFKILFSDKKIMWYSIKTLMTPPEGILLLLLSDATGAHFPRA
jgi:hypothetical protein